MSTVALLSNVIFAWVFFLLSVYLAGMSAIAFGDWRKAKTAGVKRSAKRATIFFFVICWMTFTTMVIFLNNIVKGG